MAPSLGQGSVYLEAYKENVAGFMLLMQGPVMADLVRRAIKVEASAKSDPHDPV